VGGAFEVRTCPSPAYDLVPELPVGSQNLTGATRRPVDAGRRTPRRIRTPHVANQLPDRRIDSRSTAPGPAPPTPIGAESLAMPVRDRSWLDENECSAPARPDAPEPDPEESVTVPELDAPRLPTEYRQLLAESDVLKCEIPPTLQRRHEAPVRDT